jgi:hypothetical protein
MKKLISLLIIACPFISNAQKVEIGVVGGIPLPFTQYQAVDQPATTWELNKESELGYCGGIRVMLNLRGLTQFGLACEYQNISQTSTAEGNIGFKPFKFTGLENNIAASFVTPYVFFNTGVPLRLGYIYFGVSGGYGMANMTNFRVVSDLSGNLMIREEEAKIRGFIVGAQLGYSIDFSKHWGMSIEVAGRYGMMKSDFVKQGVGYSNYEYKNTLLYIPTVIAFRYLIGEKN